MNDKLECLKDLINRDDWINMGESNGITCYKLVDQNGPDTYMATALIKKDPAKLLESILSLYSCETNMRQVDKDLISYECQQLEDKRVIRQRNKLMWPYQDRDLSYEQYVIKSANRTYILMYSVDADLVPGCVRAELVVSGYVLTPCDEGIYCHRLVKLDAKGLLPKMFVSTQVNKLRTTLEKLIF